MSPDWTKPREGSYATTKENTMINIQINTENSAFEDDPVGELVRLFDYIASHVQERNCLPKRLFDINGNACGTIKED